MAITQNTYTGDGTTVLFSFTFPYLETTDIKVSVNGTNTTAYTLANATTVQFNTAPANGAAIRIFRQTDDSTLNSTFYPGSAIRSQDLNDNFTQNLYVTQEANNNVTSATTNAASALTAANTAVTTANTALSTANTAATNATTAISTANTASSTATSASSTASSAASQAASAVSTANTALAAVSQALNYSSVANVAGIPGSPTNGDAVRVLDSTGIESFTPLSGKPGGFVGSSALTVEIYYNGPTSSWVWTRYFPVDPESRYLTQTSASSTYQTQAGMSSYLTTTAAGTTYAPLASPTFTGTVTIPAGASISGYLTTATAASTYQTQSGMSGYLATGAIGTTVQAYDANTAKTNVAQSYSAAQRGTHVTLTDGATITPDFAAGNHFTVTLGGNRTLANPTNLTAGQSGVIYIVQDGSGSKTLAYQSNWDFAGGTAPTLSTAANAVDVLAYAVRSNSSIAATLIKDVK